MLASLFLVVQFYKHFKSFHYFLSFHKMFDTCSYRYCRSSDHKIGEIKQYANLKYHLLFGNGVYYTYLNPLASVCKAGGLTSKNSFLILL